MKRTLVIGVIFGLLVGSTAVAQSITVTKPAVNETWYKGGSNPYTIVWTKQGQLPPTVIVSLRNSADTAEILTIANGVLNSGSCPWTPPASVASGSYRIRVWTPSATGTSAIFSIANAPSGPLNVTSPNGGESWPLNSSRQITWTAGAATGNVKIELYRNGTAAINKVGVIAPSVAAAAGTFPWTVGAYQGGTAPDGAGYKVMVTSTTPALQDASDNAFTIAPQGQSGGFHPKPEQVTAPAVVEPQMALKKVLPVRILAPHSGETWTLGQTYMINWTADTKPDDGFTVDLVKPDGTKVRTLLDGAAEKRPDGSWLIWGGPYCNTPVGDYKVRITSWYAQKSATSGIVHAVAKTKKTIESIPVQFQNAILECRDPGNHVSCQENSPLPGGKAWAGYEFFQGDQHYRFCIFRSRLTFDLSRFDGKDGYVESATMISGDLQIDSHPGSCGGSMVALSAGDVDKWNRYRVPQNATLYTLGGWSGPYVPAGVDITAPVREWIKKTTPNLGLVVTGADQVGGGVCWSSFHPIMYVTFIETLCGGQ